MTQENRTQPTSVVAFATQGKNSRDAARLRALLGDIPFMEYPFERESKVHSFLKLVKFLSRLRPGLVIMEGTGIAGGLALILARLFCGVHYVVSSGDPVGPYVQKFRPWAGPLFAIYERILCKCSAGFIGWTPYLVGRALTFGAPRAMTAAGWAPFHRDDEEILTARTRIRNQLGIPGGAIVVGIVGTLHWSKPFGFCYGYELVRAMKKVHRADIKVLIVGDGDGRPHLEALAGDLKNEGIFFTGRVPREQVPDYLAAMDMASLPQTIDRVGNFRYTTKISEYLSLKLPVVTGQSPLAYDIEGDWIWRLRGTLPWSDEYIAELAQLLDNVTRADIRRKSAGIDTAYPMFDERSQIERARQFITDLLASSPGRCMDTERAAVDLSSVVRYNEQ